MLDAGVRVCPSASGLQVVPCASSLEGGLIDVNGDTNVLNRVCDVPPSSVRTLADPNTSEGRAGRVVHVAIREMPWTGNVRRRW